MTTVGAAHLGLRRYDRRKVDGMRLSARAIDEVIGRFLRLGRRAGAATSASAATARS